MSLAIISESASYIPIWNFQGGRIDFMVFPKVSHRFVTVLILFSKLCFPEIFLKYFDGIWGGVHPPLLRNISFTGPPPTPPPLR